MDEHRKPLSMSSLTDEERAILHKIQTEELFCDWCNEPLFARLFFDEYEPDVLVSIELFCKACNRTYGTNAKSLRDWDDILNHLIQKRG